MVNGSLVQGQLSLSQKHAIVTTVLKTPWLDSSDAANFRPVSHLCFMSKVVERAVVVQLHDCSAAKELLPRYQSVYRKKPFDGDSHVANLAGHWALLAVDG